jgi:hypothetical protein
VGGRAARARRARLLGEAVDGGEAEKPLGVLLRRAGPRRRLPHTGAGERERQLALVDLVQGGDQPLELCAVEELDLVEQEDDPGLVLVRRLAESEEEVGEVVAEADERVDADADLEAFRGRSMNSLKTAAARRARAFILFAGLIASSAR